MTPKTASQDFNVSCVTGTGDNKKQGRIDFTLSWSEDIPMEIRVTFWGPNKAGTHDVSVIWSISRDVLTDVVNADCFEGPFGMGDIKASTSGPIVWLGLTTDEGHITLAFRTHLLAAFVNATVRMCPPEAESVDVDGLLNRIFPQAEGADQ